MKGPPRAIVTPCVQVCVMDDETGLCLGCRRTIAEIESWTAFSDAERRDILDALPARRPEGPGRPGYAGGPGA